MTRTLVKPRTNGHSNGHAKAAAVMPSSDERAEIGYLGTIILAASDPAYKRLVEDMLATVSPRDFNDEGHRKLRQHLGELHKSGAIDPTLLVGRLKIAGDLEAVGGMAYLSKVTSAVPNVAHGMYYAGIIRDHRRRRDLQAVALQLLDPHRPIDLEHAHELLRQYTDGQQTDAEIVFRGMTGTQIAAATFTTTYLIEDVYVERQPLIFGGGKKNLKTNNLLDFGVSATTGSPFLGRFNVNRRFRVAIMTGESGEATIKETLERICFSKGVDLNDDIIICHDLPRIEDPSHQRALRRFIRDFKPEALCIDPAYLCMSGDDASSVFKNGNILRTLGDVCKEENVGVVLAHHTKKKSSTKGAEMFAPPELEDLSWAGFQEWARQWILFSRRARYNPENTGHHELWMSIGGSAGHSSLWALTIDEGSPKDPGGRRWDVSINTPADARQAAEQQQESAKTVQRDFRLQVKIDLARTAIENAMRSLPENAGTKSSIQERAGMKGQGFDEAFAAMLRERKLQECEVTKTNGQKYAGFKYVFAN